METVYETKRPNGTTVQLFRDEDAQSPADWDTLGTLHMIARDIFDGMERLDDSCHSVKVHIRACRMKGLTVLPVGFRYYGSGEYRLRVCEDDQANGFIVADPARALAEGVEDLDELLRSEVETWDTYLRGDVYGYTVLGLDGESLDSCWGLYGYYYALATAQTQADAYDGPALAESAEAAALTALAESFHETRTRLAHARLRASDPGLPAYGYLDWCLTEAAAQIDTLKEAFTR